MDQASISNYESGKTEMTCTQLFELFLIFGKDLSNVFDFKNSNIQDVPIEEQEKE
ncbi:XRE family transcriptional regulator [Pseudoalteromonas sp. MMG021]|nr:XRE family transcriptional regulator [Pseudoalteromonas sp. MMG022]